MFYVKPNSYVAEGETLSQPDTAEGADAIVGAALAGLCPMPHIEFGPSSAIADEELPQGLQQHLANRADRGKVIRLADFRPQTPPTEPEKGDH